MSNLIKKSVRLPEELVLYIDGQRGSCFSQKLVRYIECTMRASDPAVYRDLSHKMDSLSRDLERNAAVSRSLALALDIDIDLALALSEDSSYRGRGSTPPGGCQ